MKISPFAKFVLTMLAFAVLSISMSFMIELHKVNHTVAAVWKFITPIVFFACIFANFTEYAKMQERMSKRALKNGEYVSNLLRQLKQKIK